MPTEDPQTSSSSSFCPYVECGDNGLVSADCGLFDPSCYLDCDLCECVCLSSSSSSSKDMSCGGASECSQYWPDGYSGPSYSADCGLVVSPGYSSYFDCDTCKCVYVPISSSSSCDILTYPVSAPFCAEQEGVQACNLLVETYPNGCPKTYTCGCVVDGECVPCPSSSSSEGGASSSSSAQTTYIQNDLGLSWNLGQGELYWYRVESECKDVSCENMGIQNDGCPSTFVINVAARGVDDLCNKLKNPKIIAPIVSKVSSVRRYSRPVFNAAPGNDDCNTLDVVEICQVPECLDICVAVSTTAYVNHDILGPSPIIVEYSPEPEQNSDSVFSLADFEFGFSTELGPILSELGEPILTEEEEPILVHEEVVYSPSPGLVFSGSALVSCNAYLHEASGAVFVGGFAYVAAPVAFFNTEGSIQVFGSASMARVFVASGGVAVSGSATVGVSLTHLPSGSITVSGTVFSESPYYSYEASGSVEVSGAIRSYFREIGELVVPMDMYATAFGFGFEYVEDTTISALTISDFTVEACGCPSLGATLSLRHNLSSSAAFSAFLDSSGLSYPSIVSLRYKAADSTWSSMEYLEGRRATWAVHMSMRCMDSSWRLHLGVSQGSVGTRMTLDIPAELVCERGFLDASIAAYFSPYSSDTGSGVKIDAVSPRKKRREKIIGPVEVFLNGFLLPHTVYYDELGLFADSFWYGAPLELVFNPGVTPKATLMDVSWVT